MNNCSQITSIQKENFVSKVLPEKDKSPNKSKNSSSLTAKVNRAFWVGMGCWSVYNLIDAGLSRFLVLETLTHGTGPLGYMGINFNGADPNFGGGKTGSSVGGGYDFHIEHSKRFFHVFKDTEFAESCDVTPLPLACKQFGNHVYPRMHAVLSGMANFGYSSALNTGTLGQQVAGGIAGYLTPTLKFRFTPEEILNCKQDCRFEDDPDYQKAAYRTSQPIQASHLGIRGSLSQGLNLRMFNRMYANPGKALLGISLLGAAALVARATYRYFKSGQQVASNTQDISTNSKSEELSSKKWVIRSKAAWTCIALTAIFLNTL